MAESPESIKPTTEFLAGVCHIHEEMEALTGSRHYNEHHESSEDGLYEQSLIGPNFTITRTSRLLLSRRIAGFMLSPIRVSQLGRMNEGPPYCSQAFPARTVISRLAKADQRRVHSQSPVFD